MTRAQAFGRYELLDRVSAGGMAEVFRARDTHRGNIVALKRILPQVAEDEEFIAMLKDEARLCSQLEHPHIARTLDFGDVNGEYFIAFEYVDGRDLRQIFDRTIRDGQRVPQSILLYIFARIGEALSYAHHRRDANGQTISLVHRDVSPQNIVVSFNGDVKLIDFGIAKARGKMARTQAGTIKGKFGYMSPEQVRGVDLDHRADVFALGVCMWELLTLKRLFQAENELQVLDRIRNMVVPPPSSLNPEVSADLDRIVLKSLSREPGERYRAAKDLYRDINALAESTATRDEVAHFMRASFPELLAARNAAEPERWDGPTRGTVHEHAWDSSNRLDVGNSAGHKAPRQESFPMAASTENKGSSDLDIFEGLGKKSATGLAAAARAGMEDGQAEGLPRLPAVVPNVPPPPSSRRSVPAPPRGLDAKSTLLGLAGAPLAPPPHPSGSFGAVRPGPLPPPGRGSLPPVVAPPPRASAAPPPPITRPVNEPQQANGAGLEMDWDDEDEATHVFDKSDSKVNAAPTAPEAAPSSGRGLKGLARTAVGLGPNGGAPGAGLAPPPPPPPPPSVRPPSQSGGRSATAAAGMGPGASSQAQFRSTAPPPPPPSAGPFARAAAPAPGTPFGGSTSPMMMPGSAPAAPQQTTAPLPMPARAGAAASQQAPQSIEATAVVRPERGRMGLWVGLAAALCVVVAGVVLFLKSPQTGRVVINVNDPKGVAVNRVEIFVDGKKWCDTAPCTIDPVSAGPHEVKVLADGFEVPPTRPVTVESHKEALLAFALAPSATRGGTGLKAAGIQPGVKLFVDDREIGPLPAEVRDLTAGSHHVRLVASDRYQALEKNVTLAKDEMLDLGTLQLRVVKGKITVTLGTPGAKVYIVSGADRRELPILPISVDIDTSKSWQLEAARPGFNDYRQPVSFDDGQAEKSFIVTLDPRTAGPAAQAQPAPQPVAAEPRPAPAPRPPPPPRPAPAPAAVADNSGDNGGGGTGESFLDINSIPVSNVLLDGKPIGTTPKLHVTVSPGKHTVVFVNAEQGLKKSVQVDVGAGETKKAIAKLKD